MQADVVFNCSGGCFLATFHSAACLLQASFNGAASLREYADYTGSYDVTPMITSQRLETADKHMLDDVLIRTIPTRETTNEAGGTTFTIGGI